MAHWPVATWMAFHLTRRGAGPDLRPDEVRLLNRTGHILWRHQHTAWSGAYESGCAWFDRSGQPHAVIPDPAYDGCLVLRLDLDSGRPLAEAPIDAAPAGINPIHHPNGWVGLSEGEGQDAARAWWVRSAGHPPEQIRLEILSAGWDDWVLSDVDPSGKLRTTEIAGVTAGTVPARAGQA